MDKIEKYLTERVEMFMFEVLQDSRIQLYRNILKWMDSPDGDEVKKPLKKYMKSEKMAWEKLHKSF